MQNKVMKDCLLLSQHWRMQEAYLILESIEAFKDELKHGVEVVWARWGDKNVGIAGKNVSGSLVKKKQTFLKMINQSLCEDTKTKSHPNATAPATASPRAADLPRPLAAVRATVLLKVFSEMASMNFNTPLAYRNTQPVSCAGTSAQKIKKAALRVVLTWSMVLQQSTKTPTGWVSWSDSFRSFSSCSRGDKPSSYSRRNHWRHLREERTQKMLHSRQNEAKGFHCLLATWVFGGRGLIPAMWLEIGRMLSWSSMTTQFLQDASERMNLRKVNQIFNALTAPTIIISTIFIKAQICTSHWIFPPHPDEPQSGTSHAHPEGSQATLMQRQQKLNVWCVVINNGHLPSSLCTAAWGKSLSWAVKPLFHLLLQSQQFWLIN